MDRRGACPPLDYCTRPASDDSTWRTIGEPMIEQERRRFERLSLAPALSARLREQRVRVIDIGPSGSRVESESPLVRGDNDVLHLEWDGETFTVDCAVVRCDSFDAKSFAAGLTFQSDPDRKSTRLNSSHANISYAVF